MPGVSRSSEQRLALIVETQRELAAAGDDLEAVMALVAARSQEITGADGAMVNLVEGDVLHTRAVTGVAAGAFDARRPLSGSVARFAIRSGQPLLIEETIGDRRIDQELRAKVGDRSLICVPLFHGPQVVGTINVVSRSATERLNEEDRRTLEVLSAVLSAAVSHVAEVEARRAQAAAIARFRTLFDGASIGILRLDCDGVAVEVNPAVEQLLRTEAGRLVGRPFAQHVVAGDRAAVARGLDDLCRGAGGGFSMEARVRPATGDPVWVALRAVAEAQPRGPVFVVAMMENIDERKRAEAELLRQARVNEHQALHDPLTGLPNRVLFSERIAQALRQARREGTRLAVALMDLDRFKEVNDSLGHAAGDQLLCEVARRVREVMRASDTVARLGGDEFGLVVPELAGAQDALPVIARIREALERPIRVHSLPLAVEASIGIAIYPEHGDDAQTLIQRADVAMYDCKREGSSHAFYDCAGHEPDVGRLTLVAELRRALARGELVLHYQPKAALDSGEVRSVEALVRWQHPERGLVYPDSFIPVAQETGLIGPLTLYVVEAALRQGRAWRDQGLELAISVNLSARNLLDCGFPAQVAALLARWGMQARSLELEVTESAMLANPKRAKRVLTELSRLGVRLAIDDFGTGYSSLAYLRQLPIDEIKIDRSFVLGMAQQGDDAVIVRSTVDLGRNLGLDVVAEGVETLDSWNRLRELGCGVAQGYFLSRPVPADELARWLQTRPGVMPPSARSAVDAA
ncbi:MAG TPA: EAL domain-containing protein [Solirubrobacteraceae bacterium]|nr:EAL domain-containing protein [Solirubrobacteraceae bacterium]